MMSERPRILIVDDTPQNIHVLKETLRDDYRIMAATNGAKALQLARREPRPDLILLDVMMPEMSGYEVIEHLQQQSETSSIPVIFVTALNDNANEEKGLGLGAVDYITKPFNPALVKARVKNHIELKRHRDDLEDEVERRTEQLMAVRAARQRLEGELEVARRLQLSMLPPFQLDWPDQGGLSAFLRPARAVGGDLYDYVRQGDQLLVTLGDVSDKGPGAALFMVKTLTLLRAFSSDTLEPETLLQRVNLSLCQNNEEFMFVTLSCCLIDMKTGRFRLASSGHEPALHQGEETVFLAHDSGPALGLMEEATFPGLTGKLEPGQNLLLYSDGVTEAQAEDGAVFGEERLLELARRHSGCSASVLCETVHQAVDEFCGQAEQFDDITILAVRLPV